MSSVKRLQFRTEINAPASVVWRHVTSPESYRIWTAAFAEGSHFLGSWEQGSRIQFLSPGGDGMVAEIAENRLNEFISIRHLGFIAKGIEDTTSQVVKSWAPAYENYTFSVMSTGTTMVVDQDVSSEWETYICEAWPKALALLKKLSEASESAA
jgi:uncharacterized protein YndB with AHSA1/START domain